MSIFRFNHVFYGLLLIAALAAFAIPQRFTDRAEPQLQALFVPVAKPVRGFTAWATGQSGPEAIRDDRPVLAIRQQNDELAQENVKLRHDLEELQKINAEREKLGDIRPLCTPVQVVGPDPGPRESLAVQASSITGLGGAPAARDHTFFVLYHGGVVGTLQVGTAGGQVRLITDPAFKATAYFGAQRPVKGEGGKTDRREFVRFNKEPVLVEGVGKGALVCRLLTMETVKRTGLAAGDWVVLSDPAWPDKLQGRRIGTVTSVEPRRQNQLFAEIKVEPVHNLLRLREVMVLTKDK